MKPLHIAALAAVIVTAGGCELFTGPDAPRMGYLYCVAPGEWELMKTSLNLPDEPDLQAPDTVAAGVAFEVVVWTNGPNGCWEAAGGEVARTDSTLAITPLDREEPGPCTQATVRLRHSFTGVFRRPGHAAIQVTGRSGHPGEPCIITQPVWVEDA